MQESIQYSHLPDQIVHYYKENNHYASNQFYNRAIFSSRKKAEEALFWIDGNIEVVEL